MRHFSMELQQAGFHVDYIKLDDENNSASFRGEITRALSRHRIDGIIVTRPSEFRLLEAMQPWPSIFKVPVNIRHDHRFLYSSEQFVGWATSKYSLAWNFLPRNAQAIPGAQGERSTAWGAMELRCRKSKTGQVSAGYSSTLNQQTGFHQP